ncbi:type II toxin-antitoxin system VapC family toxin [Mucilaginibacter sp.]|uniref:type II toxin-antitoxin system VapC family toxin n=1 Tax=Mucilaginibacter sp. TaxID=1882438 RepID=UPI0028432C57|nr:type II toxin-antitoxin system VapC family toxin [Mucilaginibacter sp.]MDR3696444.1 type II toxin-antitoxin system VapC family toxin [Mucilaginibacter sp.]
MNGFSFVADTNFLIAVHEGKDFTEPFLDSAVVVSVISEIELLGWYKLQPEENRILRSLLDDCIIFELTADIRKLAIELRQQIKVKTPDAIIAATSIYLQIPLITSDHHFKKVPGIELILL